MSIMLCLSVIMMVGVGEVQVVVMVDISQCPENRRREEREKEESMVLSRTAVMSSWLGRHSLSSAIGRQLEMQMEMRWRWRAMGCH